MIMYKSNESFACVSQNNPKLKKKALKVQFGNLRKFWSFGSHLRREVQMRRWRLSRALCCPFPRQPHPTAPGWAVLQGAPTAQQGCGEPAWHLLNLFVVQTSSGVQPLPA